MKKKLLFAVTLLSATTLTLGTLTACDETVEVTTIPAESITIADTITSLTVGDTRTLTAIVTPTDTTDTVTWTSSDPTVASVDANGTVTALTVGDVTITATAGEYSDSISLTIEHNLETILESLQGSLALEGELWMTNSSGTSYIYNDVYVYVAEDRYYLRLDYYGETEYEYRYVASEEGYVMTEDLNYDNTVSNYTYSALFSDYYWNPFTTLGVTTDDLTENEDGTFTLALPLDDGATVDDGELFGTLSGYYGYASSVELTVNNDSTIAAIHMDAYANTAQTSTWTLDLEVTDPYSIEAIVTPFETTEESETLQAFFDKTLDMNYTAQITAEDSEGETDSIYLEALTDKFYYDTGSSEYVYLDTEDGLDITSVTWNDDKTAATALTGVSTLNPNNTVADYIRTLRVAAELFEVQDDGSYVLRSEYDIYDYAYLTLIDTLFLDNYSYIDEGSLTITLDEEGGATIYYTYTKYVQSGWSYTVVTGWVKTVLSDVGTTEDRFTGATYTPSAEASAPTKWSDLSTSVWNSASTWLGVDIDDEVPFIDWTQYSTYSGLATNSQYSSYYIIFVLFTYDTAGAADTTSAANAYMSELVAEGFEYNEYSGYYESIGTVNIGVDTGSVSIGSTYYCGVALYLAPATAG